jgi:hypothetical protein
MSSHQDHVPILEQCDLLQQYKTNIISLAIFAWNTAEDDQDMMIQLTLADLKSVQKDVKADLAKWCNTIKGKLDKLGSNLEATVNLSKRATGLQEAAKELENQVDKVTVASDKIASNATPYRDALKGGTGREARDAVDGRVLINMERKAKQIIIIIKDFDTVMMTTDELMEKANGIIAEIKDKDHTETVKVKAVTRFLNGGTLFQLNSKEAAKWLKEPEIGDTFLKKLAKEAYFRERLHNVLLHGVLIIFKPRKPTYARSRKQMDY